MVLKNLKVRYRGSLLGLLWTALIPAFTSVIYFFIFKYIMKVTVDNYLVFIMSGLMPWTFFSQTLTAGLESLVNNHALLNKVPIPPQSLVLSESYTYIINLILSLPVLLCIILMSRVSIGLHTFQYFIFLIMLFVMANSISIILSFIYVFFRDLKFMMNIVVQFWFYLTPIMYAKSMIPETYFKLFYFNPIGIMFISLHSSILEAQIIPLENYLISAGWTLFFLVLSVFILKKYEATIVEAL